jgi:hypothetical protein
MSAAASKSTDDERNNIKQISAEFPFRSNFVEVHVQRFIISMKVKANLFFFFMEIQLLHTYGET